MADTTTTNYGLTKPEVGASEDTWGTKINTNLDTLDTTVDSIQGKSGAATLKHTDSAKLTTTATGIDVTGTATMDGLTVDGNVGIGQSSPTSPLHVKSGANNDNSIITIEGATNNIFELGYATAGAFLNSAAGDPMVFRINETERMRIDSSGRVGIGISSMVNPLHVGVTPNTASKTSGSAFDGGALRLDGNLANAGDESAILAGSNDGLSAGIGFMRESGANWGTALKFYTHSPAITTTDELTERMRIDSSGNVGIGTSTIIGSAANRGVLTLSGASSSFLTFGTGSTRWGGVYSSASNTIFLSDSISTFETGGVERMRIDSSGNLLVGGTSAFGADTITLGTGGFAGIRNTSGSCLELRRDSTDGSILDFQKDGSTVGSIGTKSSLMTIGTGTTGLIFDSGQIYPWNTTTNAGIDASKDLGASGARFKDLYLSGGVYLGGTGAANKLDDYEEGTWTPSAGEWSGTYSQQDGYYTKVGNLVTCWYEIEANGGTGSFSNAWLILGGVPFTIDHPANFSTMNGHWVLFDTGNTSTNNNGVWDGTFPNHYTDAGSSDGVGNYATSLITTSNSWKMRGTLIFRT
jgi:hypothetical protein